MLKITYHETPELSTAVPTIHECGNTIPPDFPGVRNAEPTVHEVAREVMNGLAANASYALLNSGDQAIKEAYAWAEAYLAEKARREASTK